MMYDLNQNSFGCVLRKNKVIKSISYKKKNWSLESTEYTTGAKNVISLSKGSIYKKVQLFLNVRFVVLIFLTRFFLCAIK